MHICFLPTYFPALAALLKQVACLHQKKESKIHLCHESALKNYSEACPGDWFWSADLPHPVRKKYWQSILHRLTIIAAVPLPCSNLALDHPRQGHRVRTDRLEGGNAAQTTKDLLQDQLKGWAPLLKWVLFIMGVNMCNTYTLFWTWTDICRNTSTYWLIPLKTLGPAIPSHRRTNPSLSWPPHGERGGTDFCHAASPSCFDRRSRNLRWGGAFMRIMPRWAPGCCNTSYPPLPRVHGQSRNQVLTIPTWESQNYTTRGCRSL